MLQKNKLKAGEGKETWKVSGTQVLLKVRYETEKKVHVGSAAVFLF